MRRRRVNGHHAESYVSRSRKLAFYLIGFVLLYLLAEGAAFIGHSITSGNTYSLAEFTRERARIVTDRAEERQLPDTSEAGFDSRRMLEILHPYLGYVIDYHDSHCSGHGFCNSRMRTYENAPLTPAGPDDYTVGIFGGSFAHQASILSTEGLLTERLQTLPGLENKRILIHSIALGGYKQPQQLIALNWFLNLGAGFDLVINLDGFNEVALPPTENVPIGTNPFFPRIWHNRVRVTRDVDLLALYGEIEYYKSLRARRAERLDESMWRYSVIRNLVWKARDARLVARVSERETRAQSYQSTNVHVRPLVVTGPDHEISSYPALFEDLAAFWAQASRQMHDVAKGQGVQYYHFLQPNQYVTDSKPLTPKELEVAYVEAHPYRVGVVEGYPLLIEHGRRLKREGIPFFDLTDLFENNTDTLYQDACCHLNQQGYDLVVDALVEAIRPSFQPPE